MSGRPLHPPPPLWNSEPQDILLLLSLRVIYWRSPRTTRILQLSGPPNTDILLFHGRFDINSSWPSTRVYCIDSCLCHRANPKHIWSSARIVTAFHLWLGTGGKHQRQRVQWRWILSCYWFFFCDWQHAACKLQGHYLAIIDIMTFLCFSMRLCLWLRWLWLDFNDISFSAIGCRIWFLVTSSMINLHFCVPQWENDFGSDDIDLPVFASPILISHNQRQ